MKTKCHLIDTAVTGDKSFRLKEQKKVNNETNVRQKVKRIWNLPQGVVVPAVIGTLGETKKRLIYWLKKLDAKNSIRFCKKQHCLIILTWANNLMTKSTTSGNILNGK